MTDLLTITGIHEDQVHNVEKINQVEHFSQ